MEKSREQQAKFKEEINEISASFDYCNYKLKKLAQQIKNQNYKVKPKMLYL